MCVNIKVRVVCSMLLVLYAPDLGPLGLDGKALMTRYEVYCQECAEAGHPEDEIKQSMDDIIPFYPELVNFKVFSIAVGKGILMALSAS